MLQKLRRRQLQAAGSKAASTAKIGTTATTTAPRKLHSIHALLDDKKFGGEFEAREIKYNFSFEPTTAAVKDGKLELTGRFIVKSGRGAERTINNARAVLLATQGGLGSSPARRQLATGASENGNTSSSDQKQEQGKSPELSQQPIDSARQAKLPGDTSQTAPVPGTPRSGGAAALTSTQSTGESSFVGVMYMLLNPLDGRALGVPLDMSKVQLNARLAPTEERGMDLQFLFSDLVLAMGGEQPNPQMANAYVQEINKVLKT